MVPYIDDIVAKMDRFAGKVDNPKELNASTMTGTGITQYEYRPKYRMTQDILNVVRMFRSPEASYYLDTASNLLYGKNSKSDNDDVSKYVKVLDRPIPQVELRIKMYELNESKLTELGIDYIRWKNGPGADILNIGADILKFKTGSEFLGKAMDIISRGSHTWTGFLVAPEFDASFLRLLAQNGTARVATSGVITVTNDYTDPGLNYNNARFRMSFTPEFQNISKNGDQAITLANDTPNTYNFFLRSPVICFKNDLMHQESAIMTFGWSMTTSSVLERDNNGQEGANTNTIQSYLTIAPGDEKLVASFKRRQKVNQNNGMPFLSDIPIVKYIFGSTTDSYAYYRYFVTFETRPIKPRPDLSSWAGNIIDIKALFSI
jgi:type II secretory pathway component GspD/PulD (secretin)